MVFYLADEATLCVKTKPDSWILSRVKASFCLAVSLLVPFPCSYWTINCYPLLSNGSPFMCSQHKDVSFHEQHKHQAFMGFSETFCFVVPWQRRFLFHWFRDSLSSQSKLTSPRIKVMKTPVACTEVTERWTSWLRWLIFQQLSLNQYRIMAVFILILKSLN